MRYYTTFKMTQFNKGEYVKCRILDFKEEHGEFFDVKPKIIFNNKGAVCAYHEEAALKILKYWNNESNGEFSYQLISKQPNLIR